MPGPYRTPIPVPVLLCCFLIIFGLDIAYEIPLTSITGTIVLVCFVLSVWQWVLCLLWINRIDHTIGQLSTRNNLTEVQQLARGFANHYILSHLTPCLTSLMIAMTLTMRDTNDLAILLVTTLFWQSLPAILLLCNQPLPPGRNYQPPMYQLTFRDYHEMDEASQWLYLMCQAWPWTNMLVAHEPKMTVSPDLLLLLLQSTVDLSEVEIRTLPPYAPESSP